MRALVSSRRTRLAAVLTVTAIAGLGPGSAYAVGSGSSDVTTVNTETVQTYLNADGHIDSSRIYEQLTMIGDGTVDVSNPVDSQDLRNLDGFGGVSAKDGVVQQQYDVDGVAQSRTVSSFDSSKLPLSVDVSYVLDGHEVTADDLVGATGDVEVTYTVKNLTTKKVPLTFTDGAGGTTTETADVPIPIVGTVVFDLPKNFTDVQSKAASMGGDGHGGTQMEYLLTLFPPIGSDTVSFGYTAHLTDGLLPPVSFTAVPVDPTTNPTFATAVDSYQSGADTGDELAAGATEINTNLLRLRDGAGTLLAGLIKLNAGAHQLDDGLSGQAAPGSAAVAAGAIELNTGLFKIDNGAGQLAAGTAEAAAGGHELASGAHRLGDGLSQAQDGTGQLDSGAAQLADGQAQLEAGLTELYQAVKNLPDTVQQQLAGNLQYQILLASLVQISNGIGNITDAPTANTLLGGLNAVQRGLRAAGTTDCGVALTGGTPTNCGALDGVDLIAGLISQTRSNGIAAGDGVDSIAELKAGILNIANVPACAGDPTCVATVNATANGIGSTLDTDLAKVQNNLSAITSAVDSQLLASGAGLDRLRAGLSNGDPANCTSTLGTPQQCGIKQVALAIHEGVPQLVTQLVAALQAQFLEGLGTPTKGCDPTKTLRCAARALTDGGRQLSQGVDQLQEGIVKLSAGGTQLAAGAGQLSDGLDQLNGGSHQLSDGTAKALDGSAQLADGAHQLSDGLSTASSGSHQLAGGLQQARNGAPQLRNGANELSKRGVVKIVDAGRNTAQQYGKLYATLTEGAKRAHTDGMAYGAPSGSMGLMAYDFEINGSDGQGSRNVTRLVLALVMGGLGLGAFALRRRSVPFLPKG